MTAEVVGILILYLLVLIALSYLAKLRTGKGVEEYYIGGRRMSGFVMAMTYAATTYSVFMMVGLVGLTYAHGVGALGFELTYLMSTLVLLALFGPIFWVLGRRKGYVTPGQLYSDRFGNKLVGATMALLSALFLVPYMAIQAMGSAYLLETLSGIPYLWGVTLIVGIMLITSLIGGFRGVAWTDTLQGLIMLFSSTALVFFAFSLIGWFSGLASLEKTFPQLTTVPGDGFFSLPMFISLTLPWAFFALTNPQVSQRLFAPKDREAFKLMIFGFFVFGFIYTIFSVVLGLQVRVLEPSLKNPDMAMPILLGNYVPLALSIPVLIGIISAGITTTNSIMLSLASLIGRDVALGKWNEEHVGYAVMVVEALVVWLFALARPGLISLLAVMASACLLSQLPTMVLGLLWRKGSASAAVFSMILGSTVTVALYVLKLKPFGLGPAVFGFAVSLVVYLAISLASKTEKEGYLRELHGWLREEGFLS